MVLSIIDFVAVLCGALFKLNHWPGGIPMLVLGLTTAVYIWIGFVIYRCIVGRDTTKPASYNSIRVVAHVFLAFSGCGFVVGTLFAICHWPGYQAQLFSGVVANLISVIAMTIAESKQK